MALLYYYWNLNWHLTNLRACTCNLWPYPCTTSLCNHLYYMSLSDHWQSLDLFVHWFILGICVLLLYIYSVLLQESNILIEEGWKLTKSFIKVKIIEKIILRIGQIISVKKIENTFAISILHLSIKVCLDQLPFFWCLCVCPTQEA